MCYNPTPWFDIYTKPVRRGFYETCRLVGGVPAALGYNYWNGFVWESTTDYPTYEAARYATPVQEINWRGLLK